MSSHYCCLFFIPAQVASEVGFLNLHSNGCLGDCVDYFGGWAAFTVSIIVIGLLTAVIGDVASHFGCTVGLQDSVTALSFVALGTSIPGTATAWSNYFSDRRARFSQ